MSEASKFSADSKKELYEELNACLYGLLDGESDEIANMANAAALLYQYLPDINWAGFYRYQSGELVLGPFQGRPACIRIPMGKGVCGTAAEKGEIQIVEDVRQFSGHISCDSSSRSEIVLPIHQNNHLTGVLDIDSPEKSRFDRIDAEGLKEFVRRFVQNTKSS